MPQSESRYKGIVLPKKDIIPSIKIQFVGRRYTSPDLYICPEQLIYQRPYTTNEGTFDFFYIPGDNSRDLKNMTPQEQSEYLASENRIRFYRARNTNTTQIHYYPGNTLDNPIQCPLVFDAPKKGKNPKYTISFLHPGELNRCLATLNYDWLGRLYLFSYHNNNLLEEAIDGNLPGTTKDTYHLLFKNYFIHSKADGAYIASTNDSYIYRTQLTPTIYLESKINQDSEPGEPLNVNIFARNDDEEIILETDIPADITEDVLPAINCENPQWLNALPWEYIEFNLLHQILQ